MKTKAKGQSTLRRSPTPATPRVRPKPKVIGLAGGVASGKSTVAAMFAQLGAEVIDADVIARAALDAPAVREKMRRHWGEEVFRKDGHPDRARIADLVFGKPEERRKLNSWVHPPVRAEMKTRLDRSLRQRTAPLIVIDAPLLIEADLDAWCDAVVFVQAGEAARAERAGKTRHWPAGELARREAAQKPLDEKRRRADAVIENNGTPEQTLAQVRRLFRQWTECPCFPDVRPIYSEGENNG